MDQENRLREEAKLTARRGPIVKPDEWPIGLYREPALAINRCTSQPGVRGGINNLFGRG